MYAKLCPIHFVLQYAHFGVFMEVVEKIKTLRELKKMSQEELAEKIFMTGDGYGKIERGERSLDIHRLEQIANALEISLSDLLAITDKSELYLVNDNSQVFIKNTNNHPVYNFNGNDDLIAENENLKLQLQHKDELLKQKETENELLKELVSTLKSQKS